MKLPEIGSKIQMYADDDLGGNFTGGLATVIEIKKRNRTHYILFEEIPGVEFVWEGFLKNFS